jgi:uncharacterized membrane protein
MMWGRAVVFFVFVLLALACVAWVITNLSRQHGHAHPHGLTHTSGEHAPSSEALRILDERFARGEIDADEFTKRRDLLKSST